jgi:ppGpp synthetase/RelA/SpoT-type nucleotidyltranferase
MPDPIVPIAQRRLIDELVTHFETSRSLFSQFLEQLRVALVESKSLASLVHSYKWRVKDPAHLKDKLLRQVAGKVSLGRALKMTKDDLFRRINDLAGFRILHLHTRQMEAINTALLEVFGEAQYPLIEGPTAKTWDDEYRQYFKSIGIKTEANNRMYTSVHYVIESNSKTKITCEVQVRTLMEEVWGEVDHKINYPHPIDSVACTEQIRVLARVTSSCTRLVDSIFRSERESNELKEGAGTKRTSKPRHKPKKRLR